MGYKATPITYKACKSPLKADASLIAGAADIGESKRKADYGKLVQSAIESGQGQKSSSPVKPSTDKEETKDETKDENKGQADQAVDPNKDN